MINIKTKEEVKIMKEGGKKLARIMKELAKKVKPGVTTEELNRAAGALILNCGAQCSFKGYQGYPTCLCTSINQEIVHVVPSKRVLKEGDIISLDLGILYRDYHADMAITLPVGKVLPQTQKLIKTTKEALEKGIKKVKPGNTFNDISGAIQQVAESQGFHVVRELCGHGIGRRLHEDPQILNYVDKRNNEQNKELKEGMVFCLEPMVTAGDWQIKKSKDNFGFETADGSLSAHFEHMIVVTKNGVKILTVI